MVESSILQGSLARLSTLSEALHCCRGPILSPGTRSLTQMNNHTPYRHVGSIHPSETALGRSTESSFSSVGVECKRVHLCESMWSEYAENKRAFSGFGRMMSKWWTFVKVTVMDLSGLSSALL